MDVIRRRRPSSSYVKIDDIGKKRKAAERVGDLARYGNTVFQVKEIGEDSLLCKVIEGVAIVSMVFLAYYAYFYYESLHFHVARGYGHLGYASAQHVVGQRLLTGRGVDKNETEAMKWFKYAADQGHPEASFNLAVGHIHGYKKLKHGHATKLLKHAKQHGVKEADDALSLCARSGCDI